MIMCLSQFSKYFKPLMGNLEVCLSAGILKICQLLRH